MFSQDRPFSDIVTEAKALGYTEPDPRDDLAGMDVARKVTILARSAFLVSFQTLACSGACDLADLLKHLPVVGASLQLSVRDFVPVSIGLYVLVYIHWSLCPMPVQLTELACNKQNKQQAQCIGL